MSKSFVMKILDETKPTSDGRQFAADTVTWRDPPLSLIATRTNGTGHTGAEAIGAIHDVWRADGSIYGRGEFATDELADEFIPLIESGALNGVSADVVGAKVELEAQEGGATLQRIHGGQIAGVTVLPIPAFDDTRILIASAAPVAPPMAWFADPKLTQLTPMTVTADGQVFGHLAGWKSCHLGYKDQCMLPPRSKSGYANFAHGQVFTAEGVKVATGVITMATGHAGILLAANEAVEHYDHTGFGAADVAVGEDAHGIWFAGSLRPNVEPDQVRTFAASGVSGDWRDIGGLDLVGLLAVNTPGFPVPRTKACMVEDTQFALVAAGYVSNEELAACCDDCADKDKKDDEADDNMIGRLNANLVAQLAAQVATGIFTPIVRIETSRDDALQDLADLAPAAVQVLTDLAANADDETVRDDAQLKLNANKVAVLRAQMAVRRF